MAQPERLSYLLFFFLLLRTCFSIPRHNSLSTRAHAFEWTALGDSYSSGVGAGEYILNSYRCLRYDQAYPVELDAEDLSGHGGIHVFHNAVCSGSQTGDVESFQFLEHDTSSIPNFQYGDRPRWGNPHFATLSVGGNDIYFPGIIFNCILEWNVWGAIEKKSCDEQRQLSWGYLNSPKLVDDIDHLIKKAVSQGRSGSIGDEFKLYLTGFPEFFNEDDPYCNGVTFARTANPIDDGKEHVKMTVQLRGDFNSMSRKLNEKIQEAVRRNSATGVKFIDIQGNGALDTHRFCEPGVKEPDQHNSNLWLFHYPYNDPDDQFQELLISSYHNLTAGMSDSEVLEKWPKYIELMNAVLGNTPPDPQGIFDNFWKWIGWRVKVFHPQIIFQKHIKDLVFDEYKRDQDVDSAQNPEEDSCDVSYKFLFDAFEIRGKNFPNSSLGINGADLLRHIKGCGKVTKWHFVWTPNDFKYQWFGSGELPIGVKNCVGNAVVSTGGTRSNCHGAG